MTAKSCVKRRSNFFIVSYIYTHNKHVRLHRIRYYLDRMFFFIIYIRICIYI